MVDIAVTGAAGNVGRVTVEALTGTHDVTQITHREHEDIESTVVDVADASALSDAVADHDVVVHLAADPDPAAAWNSVLETNIVGTYNLYEAARSGGVDRVLFASTNHVQQMYNVADTTQPEGVGPNPRTLGPEDPPRPDSYYAVSKVCGESLGSYYADRYGLEVVNLRIGWLLTESELRDLQTDEETRATYARAMWLSPRDCGQAMGQAVTTDLPETPLTVNLVSRNQERYLTLTKTMRSLGYEPRDDSSEVLP